MRYERETGSSGISRGLSIVTRAERQVVAPADGWVLYAGNYLNYGQIVILNAGQDYTILLAGLDKIDVDIGQFVLMGDLLAPWDHDNWPDRHDQCWSLPTDALY